MFASLLRPRKQDGDETTPLLQALRRYRSRDDEAPSDDDDNNDLAHNPYDGQDEEFEDEDHGRRDGPLLPVFSAEVLGMSTPAVISCLLTLADPDGQTAYPSTTPPTAYA